MESYSLDQLLRKRKALRRTLLETPNLQDLRIAVLGGSTTNELVDFLEILLLADGFRCEFYQSEYGKYYEDAVFEPGKLATFRPDVAYIHTSTLNVQGFPSVGADENEFNAALAAELARFEAMWTSLSDHIGCQIIQNNFEAPPVRILGNLDSTSYGGRTHFVNRLNMEFARSARIHTNLLIQDLHSLAGSIGVEKWFDRERWFHYKIPATPAANLNIAKSLAAMVRAIYGKSRKCLVLDLDNTLWGGVIGDDGPQNIEIGRDNPKGEAYTAFQEYCLGLRSRGVLLAVCSKNEEQTAKQGFEHPDSVLKLEHFSAFVANWRPKHENLAAIAEQLNIGLNSLVFVDDNPAERALVAAQLPAVAVPDIGADVTAFAEIIETGKYFETVSLLAEDLVRADSYSANSRRDVSRSRFQNYDEYLDSLKMTAEIAVFEPVYLDRITQLTNKTNQFNLTTKRYTQAQIEKIAADPNYVALYGKLTDVFGDNGLVSVVVARREGRALHIELWLMSCRVLKRNLEFAMLDRLAAVAQRMGVQVIHGYYYRTEKNNMVARHYGDLGFVCTSRDDADTSSEWQLEIANYETKNTHIQVNELVYGQHS